jgi:hypothetical protein
LCRLTLIPQGIINVAPLISFSLQTVGLTQVGLVGKHNNEFSLLAIGGVLDHPRRNLASVERVVSNALTDGVR